MLLLQHHHLFVLLPAGCKWQSAGCCNPAPAKAMFIVHLLQLVHHSALKHMLLQLLPDLISRSPANPATTSPQSRALP
jgi:hypothetical protein